MYLDLYRNADPEDAFDHFEEQRETNVEYLRDLPSEANGRVALHRQAGEITLNQMLHEWALHDLGHIRQIAELVRARKYLQGAGPLGNPGAAERIVSISFLNNSAVRVWNSIGDLLRRENYVVQDHFGFHFCGGQVSTDAEHCDLARAGSYHVQRLTVLRNR